MLFSASDSVCFFPHVSNVGKVTSVTDYKLCNYFSYFIKRLYLITFDYDYVCVCVCVCVRVSVCVCMFMWFMSTQICIMT